MNMQVFELLKSCEGQTLTLSFYDKEADAWVLMFEGGKSLLVDSIEEVADPRAFAQKILDDELPYAETMVVLKNLISKPGAKEATLPEAPANVTPPEVHEISIPGSPMASSDVPHVDGSDARLESEVVMLDAKSEVAAQEVASDEPASN